MDSVLKKIFEGKNDESVHDEFIKFGRGKFENKYLIEGKKQKNKWSIKTGPEFANFFVRECLSGVSGEIEIKGVIVCTFDLRNEIKFNIERIKQFAGVKQYVINTKANPSDIVGLIDKYPRAFYALSFSTPSNVLKIKAKAAKNSKPSTKEEDKPKANFCSLKTLDKNIINELFFDFPDFNDIKIKHTIIIDSVILPQGVDDPVKIRELAKKKGKIIREANVDGRVESKEKEFEV